MITPPFGLVLGGVDFGNLTIKMRNFIYTDQPPVVVRYGKFIQEIIYLLIMSLVLFFIIKSVNKLHAIAAIRRLEEGTMVKKELSEETKILIQIRNILAKKTVVVEELIL
jgi:large conductance mechanosensitive channel